jgi:hypothetical protein
MQDVLGRKGMTFDRRGVLAASVGAALGLWLGRTASAQESTVVAAKLEVPVGAAAWIKYNLNTASEEHLTGIPGAGERMTREFLEYRPYTSIG